MCDTLVATADVTAGGVTLFAKNSDRPPNEAQHVVLVPAQDHPPGSLVRCTYVEIPQVAHTYAVLLSKPFWIWGAEMGVNEHGVAIGNEAVFTKLGYDKQDGLIGMDHLRLALERAATAREAVTVITDLLAAHGQSGNCVRQGELFYHNSFMIADPGDAWVLETAGPHWAAKQIRGVYTISNGLTLADDWDMASPDLVNEAVRHKWCREGSRFGFQRCYSDLVYTTLSDGCKRRARTMALLEAEAGGITLATMIAALRDHGTSQPDWRPDRGILGATACMHAAFGPVRRSQTTGSLVASLYPQQPLILATGTAAPCTSLFKPAWLDAGWPDDEPAPTDICDLRTRYWRHELLHRATLRDYAALLPLYSSARDALEHSFVEGAFQRADQPAEARRAFVSACLVEGDAAEGDWADQVAQAAPGWGKQRLLHRIAWQGWNRKARLDTGSP